MIRRIVIPAVLFSLFLGGCARPQDEAGSAGTAPSVVASPSAAAPSAAPSSPLPELTITKPASGPTTTISGTVTAGVEPGCLLLQDGSSTHLLVFQDETLRASAPVGSQVQVTGVPKPGMMSTCQQGEPFMVSSVTPR
ncbi:hypothetical protein GCM10010168_84900 [Actinoplanes ianthinogenes]|uniref:DUF5666 domain-containing protein n=1 Tax=Actinoplanes ianthinogenes TaxID=122358 RepID=A0ABN6CJL6_9ACTN|nr:hypothetical protein [Actinoplanes ianthinogenes]BCJ44936.1 hypothetical protein Aiant_55930 [Actinoplanes ianthinogenes]GGR52899.1 hypothetical protein GCM10010168_84900 [Actinoplanes ianthinogenes]